MAAEKPVAGGAARGAARESTRGAAEGAAAAGGAAGHVEVDEEDVVQFKMRTATKARLFVVDE